MFELFDKLPFNAHIWGEMQPNYFKHYNMLC